MLPLYGFTTPAAHCPMFVSAGSPFRDVRRSFQDCVVIGFLRGDQVQCKQPPYVATSGPEMRFLFAAAEAAAFLVY